MWDVNFINVTRNDDGIIRTYRKAASYWLLHHYYGPADIKLEATTLTCDQQVIDYTNGEMLKKDNHLVAPWLKDNSAQSTLDNDYISNMQQYFDNSTETRDAIKADIGFTVPGVWSLKSCHANTRQKNISTFSGRCTHHFEKTPDHEALQGCNLDGTSPEFDDDALMNIPTYQDHVIHLTINRSRQCSSPCRVPANISDLQAILVFPSTTRPKNPTVIKFVNIGASRNYSKVQKFWVRSIAKYN